MRKLEKKKTRDGFDSDICIDIFETAVFHIVFESSIHEKASMVAISIVYHKDCIYHINLPPSRLRRETIKLTYLTDRSISRACYQGSEAIRRYFGIVNVSPNDLVSTILEASNAFAKGKVLQVRASNPVGESLRWKTLGIRGGEVWKTPLRATIPNPVGHTSLRKLGGTRRPIATPRQGLAPSDKDFISRTVFIKR